MRKIHIKRSKGQAAMEFMMTYGWAILVVLVVVAALAYIVPKQSSLTTKRCVFGSELPCLGARLSSNNLTVTLKNGLANAIYNISANVTAPIIAVCSVSSAKIAVDGKLTITCPNSGTMNLVSDSKIKMIVRYKKTQGGYDQVVNGDIYAKYN
jgi:uncharacterized protein (UPF0333 family)